MGENGRKEYKVGRERAEGKEWGELDGSPDAP